MERKPFPDTLGIKSTKLKDKFLSEFHGFPDCLDVGKSHSLPHVVKNDWHCLFSNP